MVMTVLISDANLKFRAHPHYHNTPAAEFEELLYADDTLIVHSDAGMVDFYMAKIGEVGQQYGLQFNWGKLEYLSVNTDGQFFTPTGEPIPKKDRLKYLGSLLSHDAKIGAELNQRLGAARAEFDTLSKVWAHSMLNIRRKHEIFQACVVTKLLYCLHTTWLNAAETNKIDALQARCLRKLTGILHSYLSRVSNETVRQTAGAVRLSLMLRKQQLIYLGDIARMPT